MYLFKKYDIYFTTCFPCVYNVGKITTTRNHNLAGCERVARRNAHIFVLIPVR